MFSKTALLVFATLFVAQVSSESAESQWSKITNIFEQTSKKLQEAAANVSSRIQEIAQKEEQEIVKLRSEIVSRINSTINDLKEKAAAAGASISPCFQLIPQGAQSVAVNATKGAVKCVTDMVDSGKTIVSNLVSDAEDMDQTFKVAQTKWTDCDSQSGVKQVLCKAGVAGTVMGTVVKDSADATNQITSAMTLVSTAEATMKTCAAKDLATAGTQAAGVMTSFASCVMSSITSQ